MPCVLLPDQTNGLNHVIGVREFQEGTRWLARLQMAKPAEVTARAPRSEVETTAIVRERTQCLCRGCLLTRLMTMGMVLVSRLY